MNDIEAVASLINQPLPTKLTKSGSPELSNLIQTRITEQANQQPYTSDTRLAYMTYDDLADSDIYDPTDFHTVGNLIRNNVAKAITERFPVVGDKYTLTIENLAYEKQKNRRLADEKAILQQEKSLMDRLKGDWVLIDNETGKEIERKSATILNVPRMTERGTFIRNGSELGLKHMFRLKPGIYARVKGDGTPSVHINPAQTTGRQMSLNMDQSTGIMSISRGTRNYGVLPLLRAAGVSDDAMKAAWGEELFNIQKNKYTRILANDTQMSEYKKLWDEGFVPIKLDPETTLSTMGKAYKEMSPEVLLGAANKAVKLSRSMSIDDEDDRDSLAYQRIMGPADYIPERIVRDGGGLLRKMFQRVIREGSLKSIESGAFQPQVDSVFMEDKHAGYIDGASPFEGLDFASGVSRIGEGGIGDIKAAPAETRGVNDSYLGFIDPIRCFAPGTEICVADTRKWIKVEDITVGDTAAAMNKDACGLYGNTYADVSAMHAYDYSGKMYKYDDGVVSFFVTPEHRMWVTTGKSDRPRIVPCRRLFSFFRKKAYVCLEEGYTEYNETLSKKSGWSSCANIHEIRKEFMQVVDVTTKVYCPTVPGGLVFSRFNGLAGMWVGQSPESLKVGLEVYLTYGVRKDSKGNLYANFIDKTGKQALRPMGVVAKSIVATPEYYDPSADPEEFIPAFNKGKGIEYIKRKDVDLFLANSNNMMSVGAGMIPNIGGIRSNRTLMGSKYPLQALSLKHREAPLVQRELTADGEMSTTERRVAKQLGAKFSPVDGRVVAITDDEMVVRDSQGTKHTIDLYNMYPANQKGYLHNTPVVNVGDRVKAKQLIAESNYTKGDSGALGTNLKVAYISGHGAEAFEDAIVISESASKKLASEQLHKFRGDLSSDTAYDKQRFISLFGDNDYTQEQLDKIDENGMPKIGVEFKKGDPVFLGIQIRDLSTSGLSRNASVPYVKTWEHDAPGKVTDVVKGRKHMTVYTRSFTPMQLGDKLCFDEKTEIMTKRGWALFQDLLADDEVLTLDIKTGDNYFSHYSSAFKYRCEKEPLYHLTTKRLDIFTTASHKHIVAPMNNSRYLAFQTSEQVYGKHRWFPTSCNIEHDSCFASNREDDAKERWEKYTGWVYCVTVPDTNTVFVRRNGKTVWSGNSARYGNKGVISCYDSSTYVLTDKGFKSFPELTEADKVAVLDPKTNTAHFERPQEVQHAKYKGTMYGYQDRNLSWLVTPTHDMWARPRHGNHKRHPENAEYRRRNVCDVHEGKFLHAVCAPFIDDRIVLSRVTIPHIPLDSRNRAEANNSVCSFDVHDFAEFLGWYLSEGHITHSATTGRWDVVITQAEKESDPASVARCDSIRKLLNRMGLSYSRSGIKFRLAHKSLWYYLSQFGKSTDKYIPEEVFTEWPRSAWEKLLDTMYLGDGDSKYVNVRRYATCSVQLRDDVIRLCALLGLRASWAIRTAEQIHRDHDLYRVSISTKTEACSKNSKDHKNAKGYYTEEYDGTVHCCTVSTGIIYVMRDGKPMWCGNSIIPDNEMIRDENGEPYDILQSPLGLPSRCYDEYTEFLTKDRGWQFGKDILDSDELFCFDPGTFSGRFEKQIDKFYKKEFKGKLYGVYNDDISFCVTPGHKMYVSHGKDFYECKVEDCYDRYCEFPVVTPDIKYRVVAAFALEWFRKDYNGIVYCPSVPTGYVLTRHRGKLVCLGNTNPAQLGELHLSKIAKLTGKPVAVPDFITDDTIDHYVDKQLKKYGIKPTSRIFDPRSNKYIDDVEDGYLYYYKLKHMSELKERGRGTGTYSAEEVPMKGSGAARRLGMMETSAVYSGGGMDVLKDAKLIRGQRNDEFWRKYRNGETPDIPGTPLVHKKFFSHLIASGANIERTIDGGFKLSAATDNDIKELTGNRKVQAAATFDSKTMQPISGGLFDQTIFGDEGDRWGYYELPEPVLNPLMFKPIASILGWTDKELREYLQGARKVDNEFGPTSLMKRLDSIDLETELKKAKDVLKVPRTTIQQRDLARKRIRAIHPLLQEGIKPSQLFFTRMPILPPRFRAVTVINGGDTNIAADANFLYKRMIDAADDLTQAKNNLPDEYQVDARESLYNAVNAVVGLMPTDDPKLEAKGVSGLLKWAFGKGSPKLGSVHRKVFGSNLDMGGLGTIIPNSNLTIDQVGIPEESAWSMYEPFVVRELRQSGYSMVQAMREVLERSSDAKRELLRVMSKRPVLVNRAPTLWRYGIQGVYPVIVPGRAIQVNPNIMKVMAGDFDGNCCDFDSKIFVKLSKSALDYLGGSDYSIGNAKNKHRRCKMSVTEKSVVATKSLSEGLQIMSIGEFPKVGDSYKDKNGADVYGLPSGVEVLTTDPVTGEAKYCQATSFTEEKDCECVKVTIGGRTVTVSTNATLAVFDPKGGKLVKVAAVDHNDRLVPILKRLPIRFGRLYDRDFGWWMGSLISDGWITERTVGYTKVEDCKRKEFVRIARTICENFVAREYRGSAGKGKLADSVKVHLNGTELADICNGYGIYDNESSVEGKAALRKQIPYDMILNGSEEFLYGLLSGLLDGDGSIIKNTAMKNARFGCRYSTSSPSMRETFEFLLYRLGIRFSTTVTPPRNWSKESYNICPSTVDMAAILDKLTCIGSKEIGLIEEWKLHRTTIDNQDTIPISEKELEALRKAGLSRVNNSLYSAFTRPSRCVTRALAMKFMSFIEPLAPEFAARVKNTNTIWRPVSKIENAGKRDVYDFAIPETKVFVVNVGVTIYDSMTTHVPVSQTAIEAIDKSMLPSRNLLSPQNFKAHFIPRDASNEGLFLASRVAEGKPVRFRTEAEAQAAYDRGEIKIDTPIEIG